MVAGKRWPALPAALRPGDQAPRHGSWFARDPAWPIVALLAGWPLWWALGIGPYMPVIVGHPDAQPNAPVEGEPQPYAPVSSGARAVGALPYRAGSQHSDDQPTAPDTVASPVSARVLSWAVRTLSYAAAGRLAPVRG